VGWALVYATVAIELGSFAGLWRPLGALGVVYVPASAVPAFLLLGHFGARLWSQVRRWWPFLVWAAVIAAVPAWWYRDLFDGASGLSGYTLAALQEEMVFRAAFPLLVWRLLDRAGADAGWSRAGAILFPAALFAILPYHLRQADSALGVLPFFTFAVFMGLLVRRPDVLPAAALAHLTVNLLTVPVAYGAVSPLARMVAVSVLLCGFAFVALFVAGEPEPEPAVAQVASPGKAPASR
jgi:membrane protease YdiL (CAAX protease family)